jgi:hypothetical protein
MKGGESNVGFSKKHLKDFFNREFAGKKIRTISKNLVVLIERRHYVAK